jgi:hypothetical protein
VNLVTGANHQVTRAAITPDGYTADNSALRHNDTNNGIMSLPLLFCRNQKIMLEIDGTYARGYLQLMLNGTWVLSHWTNEAKSTPPTLFPNKPSIGVIE